MSLDSYCVHTVFSNSRDRSSNLFVLNDCDHLFYVCVQNLKGDCSFYHMWYSMCIYSEKLGTLACTLEPVGMPSRGLARNLSRMGG